MALTKVDKSVSSTPGIVDNSDATAITIDSSERVGIGTSSPTSNLHVFSSSGNAATFMQTTNSGSSVSTNYQTSNRIFYTGIDIGGANSAYTIYDGTAGAERMRITSSGVIDIKSGGSASAPSLIFEGDTDTGFFHGTNVLAIATSGSERARIDASGNFMVGQTSMNYNVVGGSIASNGLIRGASTGQVTAFNRKGSDGEITVFYKDGVSVGSISTNGSSLPVSDRNFKKDISDLDLGLDLITKLKPSQFRFKVSDEDSPLIYGLIAQDLEESLEELGVEKNSAWLLRHEPKEDVNEADYSVDYTALIPILINSIQEQQEQIEALQSEINTLKGE